MKILHVISSVHRQGGGTSEVIPRLCQALAERNEDVTLATLRTDDVSVSAERAFAAGVRYEGSCRSIGIGPLWAFGYSPEFKRRLRPLVAWADIVHIHGLWMWPMWRAAWEAKRQKKPYVMMPHGFLEPERLKISKWKKRVIGSVCDRPLLKSANAVIATSESELRGIRQYGIDIPAHIMPIGLDVGSFRVSECRGRTLLYFSRITPIKGLDLLASAWGAMDRKGWRLLIVGPDDRGYANAAKALFAANCPSGSYAFRGPVFGEEKYELLSDADAFVLPTRSENWSIAVAEAMASGLPVVCTKGAPWACINACGCGHWVDVSVEAIREGLEDILSLTDAQRREMGLRGRRWVEQNLSWATIAENLVKFYDRCMRVSSATAGWGAGVRDGVPDGISPGG